MNRTTLIDLNMAWFIEKPVISSYKRHKIDYAGCCDFNEKKKLKICVL